MGREQLRAGCLLDYSKRDTPLPTNFAKILRDERQRLDDLITLLGFELTAPASM
jgi:hypothetical protein